MTINSLNIINRLVVVTEMLRVLCEVEIVLFYIYIKFVLRRVNGFQRNVCVKDPTLIAV
jgi:hypothetical protein